MCQLLAEETCGVSHGAELDYVFGKDGGSAHPAETRMSQIMGTLWTDFAKHGVPAPDWPQYDSNTDQWMMLSQTPHVIHGPQRCAMWDSLPREDQPYYSNQVSV